MKALIISDPKDPQINKRIRDAKEYLKSQHYDTEVLFPYQKHSDLENYIQIANLLNQGEIIFCTEGWLNDPNAIRLKCLAEDFGLKTIYSLNEYWTKILNGITKISNAIESVFDLSYSKFTSKSRERNRYFARLIFFGLCRKYGFSLELIAILLNRDHTTAYHLIQNFDNELNFNKDFKTLNEKVLEVFNSSNPGCFLSEKECYLKINQLRNSER
jgi:hypothetical protein